MHLSGLMIAGTLTLGGAFSVASMNGTILDADILDARVQRCGVSVEGNGMATVRPFIETSDGLKGTMQIKVQSRSGSNTNTTVQVVSFPGSNVIRMSRPTSMRIEMNATSDGVELCRMNREIDFDTIDL